MHGGDSSTFKLVVHVFDKYSRALYEEMGAGQVGTREEIKRRARKEVMCMVGEGDTGGKKEQTKEDRGKCRLLC